MIKCPYCNGDTTEIPDFDDAECYGDFHHICNDCGAIGYEVFGHGISWEQNKSKSCQIKK